MGPASLERCRSWQSSFWRPPTPRWREIRRQPVRVHPQALPRRVPSHPWCSRLPPSATAAAPDLRNGLVSWLHFPKCGTSLVAALAGAFCPSLPAEHSAECPLNASLHHWTLKPTRQWSGVGEGEG